MHSTGIQYLKIVGNNITNHNRKMTRRRNVKPIKSFSNAHNVFITRCRM